MTIDKVQQLGVKKNKTVERDSTFKSNMERKLEKEKEQFQREAAAAAESPIATMERQSPIPIELELLSVGYLQLFWSILEDCC